MSEYNVKVSPQLTRLVLDLREADCEPQTTETGSVQAKCPTCLDECLQIIPSNDPPMIVFCKKGNPCTKESITHATKEIIQTKREALRKSDNGHIRKAPFGYNDVFVKTQIKDSQILESVLLAQNIELRWNKRADHREIRQNEGDWIHSTTRTMNAIRQKISETYGYKRTPQSPTKPLKWNHNDWRILLNAHDCKYEVDPFQLWLEQLPAWDKKERIDTLLHRSFLEHRFSPLKSLQSKFGKWASRFPFIASIQLTYLADSSEPQDQIHTRPLLVGDSGIGKSQYLKSLLPPKQGWFTDSFSVYEDEKKMVEILLGCVLAEWSELSGLTPKALNKWKAFSTSSSSRVRLTYREDAENYVRNVVIIGTTNDFRCIPNDIAGWRRDLPILLGHAPQAVEPYIMEHREQLWAEALHKFTNGTRAEIPHQLRKDAMKHSERFRQRIDPIEDAIAKLPPTFKPMTTSDLMVKAGMVEQRKEIHNISAQKITHFINLLHKSGCEEVDFQDDNGKYFSGWQRQPKEK